MVDKPRLAIVDGDEMDIDLASQIRFEDRKALLCVAGEADQVNSLLLAKCAFGKIIVGLFKSCVLVPIKGNEHWYLWCWTKRNHQVHHILHSIPKVLKTKLQRQLCDGMPCV